MRIEEELLAFDNDKEDRHLHDKRSELWEEDRTMRRLPHSPVLGQSPTTKHSTLLESLPSVLLLQLPGIIWESSAQDIDVTFGKTPRTVSPTIIT